MKLGQDVLTSGQVAHLLGCAIRTINKWSDLGLLPGWRLPPVAGSQPGPRRFLRLSVEAFASAYHIPIRGETNGCP